MLDYDFAATAKAADRAARSIVNLLTLAQRIDNLYNREGDYKPDLASQVANCLPELSEIEFDLDTRASEFAIVYRRAGTSRVMHLAILRARRYSSRVDYFLDPPDADTLEPQCKYELEQAIASGIDGTIVRLSMDFRSDDEIQVQRDLRLVQDAAHTLAFETVSVSGMGSSELAPKFLVSGDQSATNSGKKQNRSVKELKNELYAAIARRLDDGGQFKSARELASEVNCSPRGKAFKDVWENYQRRIGSVRGPSVSSFHDGVAAMQDEDREFGGNHNFDKDEEINDLNRLIDEQETDMRSEGWSRRRDL